jgi:FeS assembly SUF system protein
MHRKTYTMNTVPKLATVQDEGRNPMTTIQKSLFEAEVIEQIRTVYDPEIPINVYDLGLIYDIQIDDEKNVHVMMTLTSPSCPVAGTLPGEVETAVRGTYGVGKTSIELTWDPPFTIEMMSEEAKLILGLD